MKSSEDPYADVHLIELALGLAFRVPRFPAKARPKSDAAVRAAELNSFMTEHQVRLKALCLSARGGSVGSGVQSEGNLSPRTWQGKRHHFASRHALIKLLWDARSSALEALRLLPQPNKYGKWERAVPLRFQGAVPPWEDLTERLQNVAIAVSEKKRTAKQLGADLGIGHDAARKALVSLKDFNVVRRAGRDGYVIAQVPIGAPSSVKLPT